MGEEGGAIVGLVEDGLVIDHVEGGTVWELHLREGGFLGKDLFDVGIQQRVGRQQGLSQGTLHRGLELRLGSGGQTVERNFPVSISILCVSSRRHHVAGRAEPEFENASIQ